MTKYLNDLNKFKPTDMKTLLLLTLLYLTSIVNGQDFTDKKAWEIRSIWHGHGWVGDTTGWRDLYNDYDWVGDTTDYGFCFLKPERAYTLTNTRKFPNTYDNKNLYYGYRFVCNNQGEYAIQKGFMYTGEEWACIRYNPYEKYKRIEKIEYFKANPTMPEHSRDVYKNWLPVVNDQCLSIDTLRLKYAFFSYMKELQRLIELEKSDRYTLNPIKK